MAGFLHQYTLYRDKLGKSLANKLTSQSKNKMDRLNPKQKLAMEMAEEGHNFTLLGSAGSGKSFVIAAIVENLRSLGRKVALTCSTGIACLVYDKKLEAQTIHKFTGIEDGRHAPTEVGPYVYNSPKAKNVVRDIQATDVLIIDECSMISRRTLDSVAEVLALKDPSLMFGGIQVILCGDFRQLPPVKDIGYGDDGSYCFEASCFKSVFPHSVVLTDIVRQSDINLINVIREVSQGRASPETITFMTTVSVYKPSEVHLFSKNSLVDDYNRRNILDFPRQLYEFLAVDEGEDKSKLEKLTVPKKLWLKVGIPVILLRNLTNRLVNGLRGEVIAIDEDGPTIAFKQMGITTRLERCSFEVFSPLLRRNVAVRKQFPIKPAFGLTIHKSQGMTLDRVCIDCRDIFQAGQLGVAMSRVRSTEGLTIINFDPKYCIGHPVKVEEFLEKDSAEAFQDCRCCRNCKRNPVEKNVQADDCVPSDDIDSEDEFDEEFDKVLIDMDSFDKDSHTFPLPEDFSLQSILDGIKTERPLTDSQLFINSLLSDLPLEKLEIFCKKEFLILTQFINELNITEPRAVKSHELTSFYTKVSGHLSSVEYTMNCLSVFDYSDEAFTKEHKSICFSAHSAVRKFLLQQKTILYQEETHTFNKRFLTNPSKARLRYVAGYCFGKLKFNYNKKKAAHRFSVTSESQLIFEEMDNALVLLNFFTETEDHLKSYTSDEASLRDISRRQYVSRNLTHISDDLFSFFILLCEISLKLLVKENLNKYGEKMFSICLENINSDDSLKSKFIGIVSGKLNDCASKSSALVRLTEDVGRFKSVVDQIYRELVKKFLMVLFAQFRKDLKSSYHVEKTMAHRKQIRTTKKKIQTPATETSGDQPSTSSKGKRKATKKISSSEQQVSESSATETSGDQPCTSSKGKRKAKKKVSSSEQQVPESPAPPKKTKASKVSQKKTSVSKEKSSTQSKSGSYVNEAGETVWVCPTCGVEDDGNWRMVGCDGCEEWYHWDCVGLESEPGEDEWFCPFCDNSASL